MNIQKMFYLLVSSLILSLSVTTYADAAECGVPSAVNTILAKRFGGQEFLTTELVLENGSKFSPIYGSADSGTMGSLTTAMASNMKVCLEKRADYFYISSISK